MTTPTLLELCEAAERASPERYIGVCYAIGSRHAELKAALIDAERYRWLREKMTHYEANTGRTPVLEPYAVRIWYHASDNTEWPLGAAIDAARLKETA